MKHRFRMMPVRALRVVLTAAVIFGVANQPRAEEPAPQEIPALESFPVRKNGDYLVQERVPTARETFPALTADGQMEFAEQLVDLDPLLFNGKVGSAFTRLSSTELANVSSGGGMVPTYIISKK